MSRLVNCIYLKSEAEGLDAPPYPGELGLRIFDSISREAWELWLQRSVMIINEYQLNSANPEALQHIEEHMKGFLFSEGDLGDAPSGFMPRSKK